MTKAASIMLLLGGGLLLLGGSIPKDLLKGISFTDPLAEVSSIKASGGIWNDLANYIDAQSGSPSSRIPDTDYIVKMVDRLKDSGFITDDSRVDSLRKSNTAITESNKNEIVRLLR